MARRKEMILNLPLSEVFLLKGRENTILPTAPLHASDIPVDGMNGPKIIIGCEVGFNDGIGEIRREYLEHLKCGGTKLSQYVSDVPAFMEKVWQALEEEFHILTDVWQDSRNDGEYYEPADGELKIIEAVIMKVLLSDHGIDSHIMIHLDYQWEGTVYKLDGFWIGRRIQQTQLAATKEEIQEAEKLVKKWQQEIPKEVEDLLVGFLKDREVRLVICGNNFKGHVRQQ
jgi:hypothetical protein